MLLKIGRPSNMFEKCINCKRTFPVYMVTDYKILFLTPLCPICALGLINQLYKKHPDTPFKDENDQEVYDEAIYFLSNQCKKNWGGHMINPSEECPHRFETADLGSWVDIGNCNLTCKDHCVRYYQWKGMSQEDRKEELFENGVINA